MVTCHRRKSLKRTSPDVRINKSTFEDLFVYKHFSTKSSLISLIYKKTKTYPLFQFLNQFIYSIFNTPFLIPSQISLHAFVISSLDP
jgi:hypothetical protein